MMDSVRQNDDSITFRNVQITDLEDAYAIVPDSKGIVGRTYGNHFWRSPESWAKAVQDIPSDIFSFGLVVSFAPLFLSPLTVTRALPIDTDGPRVRRYMFG